MALAYCLSSAFSSGIWEATPMPIGGKEDPDSALGIIGRLGARPVIIAASPSEGVGVTILGCVLGCVMDAGAIERYHLSNYDAEPGDGLLAFIGIVPEAQGLRLRPSGRDTFEPASDAPSLARNLFGTWLGAEQVQACPRLFVRTRPPLGPICHLSLSFGFTFCGSYDVDFRGQRQTRLVYRRTNGLGPAHD